MAGANRSSFYQTPTFCERSVLSLDYHMLADSSNIVYMSERTDLSRVFLFDGESGKSF